MVIGMVSYLQLVNALNRYNPRSAWNKGVKKYAISMVTNYEFTHNIADATQLPEPRVLERVLLRGAFDWKAYSYGGLGLIYDYAIAELLCTPSELVRVRRKDGSLRKPNAREEWLDTQARALYQAFELIRRTYHELEGE